MWFFSGVLCHNNSQGHMATFPALTKEEDPPRCTPGKNLAKASCKICLVLDGCKLTGVRSYLETITTCPQRLLKHNWNNNTNHSYDNLVQQLMFSINYFLNNFNLNTCTYAVMWRSPLEGNFNIIVKSLHCNNYNHVSHKKTKNWVNYKRKTLKAIVVYNSL